MKKKAVVFILLILFFCVNDAAAEWNVSVQWVASADPHLKEEVLIVAGQTKCTVPAGQATACAFKIDLVDVDMVVEVWSINTQGAYSVYEAGQIYQLPVPASGGVVVVSYTR